MECQVEKTHFRHLLLFTYNQGLNAAKAAENIQVVYGDDSISDSTACKWFLRFKEGNFDLDDAPRCGRPTDFDEDRLNVLIHDDPYQTTRELAEKMDKDHMTIARHLKSMEKVQKLGAWVPHQLSANNKIRRITISALLLARHRQAVLQHRSFFKLIITGDEKWCLYANMKRRKQWLSLDKQVMPRAKSELHPRKTMLSVWWDWEGVIHFELLQKNRTVTAELYLQQLQRLANAIEQKRPNR
nr:PREDICTED: histone-lysine N-methyltransferase SETMAR-like [Linepithema humile]